MQESLIQDQKVASQIVLLNLSAIQIYTLATFFWSVICKADLRCILFDEKIHCGPSYCQFLV